jgi:hypothetical protein
MRSGRPATVLSPARVTLALLALGLLPLLGSAHAPPTGGPGEPTAQPEGPVLPSASPTEPRQSGPPPAPWFVEWEDARIRSHLERVEAHLRAHIPPEFSREQRAARLRQMDRLAEYRRRGDFPRNPGVPGRVPVFRDHRGVLCAVGHLLAVDGHHDLVDRVARERNLARIPELADEVELLEWLERNGLTVDEATWIQPMYNGLPGREEGPMGIPSRYRSVSLASGVVGGLATAWNLAGMWNGEVPTWGVTLGIAAGASSVALGALRLDEEDAGFRRLAAVNLAVGALSLATAIESGRRIRVEVRPWILLPEDALPPPAHPNGTVRTAEAPGMGVRASIRF